MSQNIEQIYTTNPASSMQSTDLLYLGRSPYGVADDFGITWANMQASVLINTIVWSVNASSSFTAAVQNGYILTSGSSTTVTLPTVFAAGSLIGIKGQGAAWTLDIGAGTSVEVFSDTYTTSIASANNVDSIILIGTVANTTWGVLSLVTTGFTAS